MRGTALFLLMLLVPAGTALQEVAQLSAGRDRQAVLQEDDILSGTDARQALEKAAAAFGFQVGEERHYVIGPPDVLHGVLAEWTIRLDRIVSEGEEWLAVFSLEYKRSEPYLLEEQAVTRWLRGELTVNEFGFPTHMGYTERMESDSVNTVYSYEGGRYRKLFQTPEGQWEFDVAVASNNDLDPAMPKGMYLFEPGESAESLFSNPGLLSLVLPHPNPPASWQHSVRFFVPRRAVRWPDESWHRKERAEKFATISPTQLNLGEITDVEIGDRTVRARSLEVGGPLGWVYYVDSRGRVLRADLRRGMWRPLWIRLSSPLEH